MIKKEIVIERKEDSDSVEDSNKVTMLTTADNPFDPFTQFDDWQKFDESKGYYTCSYLARIARLSEELSEADEKIEIDNAINEIIKFNLTGNYKKVTKYINQ